MRVGHCSRIAFPDGKVVIIKNGKRHCANGPAVSGRDGQEWYWKGKLHRENGPAVIRTTGYQAWYRHGKRHRDDGPAAIHGNGLLEWWVDGKSLTRTEFFWYRVKRFFGVGQ